MKNKVEKSSNLICRMLEELHPCYYSFRLHEDIIILCQSPDDPEISKVMSQFLDNSMKYFMNSILPNCSPRERQSESFHKTKIANLMISCREQIQEQGIQGSCAIGICYVIDKQLFCIRTSGIEVFLIDEQNSKIKAINGSCDYVQNKRARNRPIEEAYFSATMPKIKAEFLYECNDFLKKQIYFSKTKLPVVKQIRGGFNKLLMGCSQTFDLITPDFLFKHFKDHYQKSDCEKVNGVLEQAKKKMKSVTRQDISLACWRVDQSQMPSITSIEKGHLQV